MKMFSRSKWVSIFSYVLLLVLSDGVWCHNLLPLQQVPQRVYLNGTWINKMPRPSVPAWPDQFTSDFYVYVEEYGENFRTDGAVFYDWTKQGLGAVPPDWMKIGQYNGTDTIQDVPVDVWFPGTSDPNKPCYGYWSAKDTSKRPIQFFGLSSLGPTILDYYTFSKAPPNTILTKPNRGCEDEIVNHQVAIGLSKFAASTFPGWPKWPQC